MLSEIQNVLSKYAENNKKLFNSAVDDYRYYSRDYGYGDFPEKQSVYELISALKATIRERIFAGNYERDFVIPKEIIDDIKANQKFFMSELNKFEGCLEKYKATSMEAPGPVVVTYEYTKNLCDVLEYVLSLSNIETSKVESNTTNTENEIAHGNDMPAIKVFISYSQGNKVHENIVLRFTDFLRTKGFHAENDKLLAQKETAIDFVKMMHIAVKNYRKIIIVLSKEYKTKAESFTGGVGTEFSLILKDIDENLKKYIFVSFEALSENIVPFSFKGREVIDLSVSFENDYLFAKLLDESKYEFSPVAKSFPKIETVKISEIPLEPPKNAKLEISKFSIKQVNMSAFSGFVKFVEYNLQVDIRNNGGITIDEYSLEIHIPYLLVYSNSLFEREGEMAIARFYINRKLFIGQSTKSEVISFRLTNFDIKKVIGLSISAKVHYEHGESVSDFPIRDLNINIDNISETRISSGLFLDTTSM